MIAPGAEQPPPADRRHPLRDLACFAGLQGLTALIGFILLPVIARQVGPTEWAVLAVSQSIGAIGSQAIDMGWSLTGPGRVGRASTPTVAGEYAASLRMRGAAALIVLPAVGLVAVVLAPREFRLLALLMALALAVAAFSPAWFVIGTRTPGLLVRYEVVPRLLSAVISAVLIHSGANVVVYPIVVIVLTTIAYAILSARLLRGQHARRSAVGIRGQIGPMLSVLTAGAYAIAGPLLAAVVTTSAQVAVFSSGERLFRVGLLAVVATTSAFQGWVVNADPQDMAARIRWSVGLHLLVGVLGGLCVALLTPLASRVFFSSELATTKTIAAWLGLAFVAIAANSSLARHALLPLGHTRAVTRSIVVGAVIGVPLILVLGHRSGGAGVAAGLALSEVVVTAVQLGVLTRARRTPDGASAA